MSVKKLSRTEALLCQMKKCLEKIAGGNCDDFSGGTDWRQIDVIIDGSMSAGIAPAVPANGNRKALLCCWQLVGTVRLTTKQAPASSNFGIVLNDSNPSWFFHERDYGSIVKAAWFVAGTMANNFTYFEFF